MDNTTPHLTDLMADIQRRWGRHALYRGSDRQAQTQPTLIATGYPALDTVLEGCIPRGQVSELLGAPTSGMTTLLHHVIARAQSDGDNALYFDLDGTFDPDYVARCGIDLDKLVVARTDTINQALEIVRDLLLTCRVGVLAVDFTLDGHHPLPDPSLLRRVNNLLARSNCALVFLVSVANPQRVQSISIAGDAALRLAFARQRWLYANRDVRGCRSTITVLKHKRLPGNHQVAIDVPLDSGGRS